MTDATVLILAAAAAGFVVGLRLGRWIGRRDAGRTLARVTADVRAFQRARNAQDARTPRSGYADLPRLSQAERDAWDARELS